MTLHASVALLSPVLCMALLDGAVSARSVRTPVQVEVVPAACVPFEAPIINRPIDSASNGCGLAGDEAETSTASKEHGRQNRAKNNFCASQSVTAALVTRFSFDRLDATRPAVTCCGRNTLPTLTERDALQTPFYTTTDVTGEHLVFDAQSNALVAGGQIPLTTDGRGSGTVFLKGHEQKFQDFVEFEGWLFRFMDQQ